MRRIVSVFMIMSAFVLSSATLVGGQGDPVTPPLEVRTTPGNLSNMIGDVDVPWEILEYIQMKYEGHAVTKADKIKRGNTELYRLRVDRDDIPTDYESIAVLFNMKWKLISEEKYATPPTPPPAPIQKPKVLTKPTDDKKPEVQPEKPPKPKPQEGGRGAGSEPATTQADSSENTETVSPKPDPDTPPEEPATTN